MNAVLHIDGKEKINEKKCKHVSGVSERACADQRPQRRTTPRGEGQRGGARGRARGEGGSYDVRRAEFNRRFFSWILEHRTGGRV